MTAWWTYEPNSYLNAGYAHIYPYKDNFGCIICLLQKLLLRNVMFIVTNILQNILFCVQQKKKLIQVWNNLSTSKLWLFIFGWTLPLSGLLFH